MPAYVFRRIGSSAYPVNARIASSAAFSRNEGTGSSSPNNARLGTVCSTFANPITGLASPRLRVSRIPSGNPTPAARSIAESVSHRCSNVSRPISHPCARKKSIMLTPHDVQHEHNPLHEGSRDAKPRQPDKLCRAQNQQCFIIHKKRHAQSRGRPSSPRSPIPTSSDQFHGRR